METDGKIWLIVVKTCRDNTAAQERKHHRHIQKPTNCNITMPQGKIRCFGFTTKFAQMFHNIHFLSFVSRICNTMNFDAPPITNYILPPLLDVGIWRDKLSRFLYSNDFINTFIHDRSATTNRLKTATSCFKIEHF